jgi:hypothetical protein
MLSTVYSYTLNFCFGHRSMLTAMPIVYVYTIYTIVFTRYDTFILPNFFRLFPIVFFSSNVNHFKCISKVPQDICHPNTI